MQERGSLDGQRIRVSFVNNPCLYTLGNLYSTEYEGLVEKVVSMKNPPSLRRDPEIKIPLSGGRVIRTSFYADKWGHPVDFDYTLIWGIFPKGIDSSASKKFAVFENRDIHLSEASELFIRDGKLIKKERAAERLIVPLDCVIEYERL